MMLSEKKYEYFESMDLEKRKIKRIEDDLKQKPTEKNIEFTISVLGDFKIRIKREDVPEFNSVSELERWQKRKIKEKITS